MSVHLEVAFEKEVCENLGSHGWLYEDGAAAHYNRKLALYPPDLIAWLEESQKELWDTYRQKNGSKAEANLLQRIREQLDLQGTLDLLRNGIEVMGLPKALKLAEFKPALGLNPEILARYKANRLRVVRQVRYSLHNENCIDLVLFLNGIPVATVELKTDNTQSIEDAVWQYKADRLPRLAGKTPEPLLSFPSGALVHFAVSNREVRMTTKLAGPATVFLPFNKGSDPGGKNCGAGNPVPNGPGHPTDYLWQEVWERESWLEILGRYCIAERNKKKQVSRILFPRYHQLVVTRLLQEAVRNEGPGQKYLIQHSAGSGKTNSIAWTAHFFSELHDAENKKVFDSVLVVSDRNVIDTQLQEALESFERKKGVVASITSEEGSKSGKLAQALSGDKKVVVCTIQTFPFALEAVRDLTATEGKRFAVIADEAHSSQTGQAAEKLKKVLSASEAADLADGGEVGMDEVLAAQMADRVKENGITYVAFTATPKAKTLELFGRRPNPNEPAGDGNLPEPFHVYSMRQAIEEGFILDVLQNYTSYSMAFHLAQDGQSVSDEEVERSAAKIKLMGWVKLHPHNIAQKVQIIVEHFLKFVAPLLDGKAKAMVVVGSRKEAVRWKLAIDKYIREKQYPLGTLVAFSGEVKDDDSGPDPFTERSSTLNPGLKGDIREAFKGDEFQILLVANKFQTGFDQPLLCGMYVDRRLSGIQAVQTLSRLNRCHPGKTTTYVVDFANEPDDILAAFKAYYETAELAEATDPQLILSLKAKLDSQGHYDEFEIERVVKVLLDPNGKQSELIGALEPVAQRLMHAYKEARLAKRHAEEINDPDAAKTAKDELDALTLFRSDMGTYVRFYTFLCQIFDYGNTGLEKRAMVFKRLLPLLEFEREMPTVDLSKVVLTHHTLRNKGQKKLDLTQGEAVQLAGLAPGGGTVQDKDKALLSEIIAKLNDLFTGDLTDEDKVTYVRAVIRGKLLESTTLRQQASANSKEQFASSPDFGNALMDAIISALDAHQTMSAQALNSADVRDGLKDILLNQTGLYEDLRDAA
ncbi:type I restriction endonuclease subunit R [Vulcanococcus limneticus Candia 3F8]|uniref:type I restriction endonuclease subunit R n=1 Tax=Vulcanococcus limneticus TaxID=2170428 RepID=UPI000B97F338|nr:type I restriction endonuclease [Vulcanococcus limneticus]MCP9793437.1 type I restriction endonuclease subunit R [Vulcanococcus limneticus MW73D5]MCP9895435.1 type I restriction endonuclease subunit R [Vulcanococcus limneticus Candia 3F8]MCP9898810.1 type I restriction endonuclease subunit R [Vulcanococcus limneticus Candia 3B3]